MNEQRVYKTIVKPLLFRLEAERAHNLTLRAITLGSRSAVLRRCVQTLQTVEHPRLRTRAGRLELNNPLGLAAGFDKNGRGIPMLDALGFGLIEIGSVSGYPSVGNPRPRLFRIPQDEGVVVAYGVPNDGAAIVESHLVRPARARLGINLVKTNDPQRPAIEPDVYEDFARSFQLLRPHADYIMLNLSCPNSADDRDFFDDLSRVHTLLQTLSMHAQDVPVYLKIKPTKDAGLLRELVAIADEHPFIAGFAINLPAGRPADLPLTTPRNRLDLLPGVIAGPPVEAFINEILAALRRIIGTDSRYVLMAAGGVTSAEAAYRKIRLGASVVQLYTGLVYHGPGLLKSILHGIVDLLERDDFDTVTDAVGIDVD
uniref:quinone-dependent dihydroorotate dehydrogenase n=1 Tax=Nonomuraea bangladeshensis TaxID=404385 RepID=UPI003F493546